MAREMRERAVESSDLQDVLAIEQVIARWAVWRDAGDWERFGTLWHPDGYMTATWFQGPAREFIEVSRTGFEKGVRISHFLGGSSVDVVGGRAIAQTKMTITQRAYVHEVEADVVCHGRFYDFMARLGDAWKIVRRQPIYEHDRIDPLDPAATLDLDPTRLSRFPVGYRHLAYMQSEAGFTVKPGLPGLTGSAVTRLYAEGEAWLQGSDRPGVPL
ncbi:nuclear transport factor 2 family protein [Spongiactinospora gelatinilytica]|nr:nuclear transport factor 2 family protein [Spongiactinospora gelatinilytica]